MAAGSVEVRVAMESSLAIRPVDFETLLAIRAHSQSRRLELVHIDGAKWKTLVAEQLVAEQLSAASDWLCQRGAYAWKTLGATA